MIVLTFEERLIEEAKDAIAAEIHQSVPSKQLIDHHPDQWTRIGSFGPNSMYKLYRLEKEVNQLYCVNRNGVTIMWMAPEFAEELADMICDSLEKSGEQQ